MKFKFLINIIFDKQFLFNWLKQIIELEVSIISLHLEYLTRSAFSGHNKQKIVINIIIYDYIYRLRLAMFLMSKTNYNNDFRSMLFSLNNFNKGCEPAKTVIKFYRSIKSRQFEMYR